jgi:translocation and assembly module TamB
MALLVLLVAAAVLTARYGVLAPQARLLIEARTSGIRLGRFGRLKVEGLGGDVWRHFTIRRLTVSDEKGVWLRAEGLDLRWSYGALVRRRLQVDAASVGKVTVLRRPTLAAKGPPSAGLPLTINVRQTQFRLETLPAFSQRYGLYDVQGKLRLERGDRGQSGAVRISSLTHLGDYLDVAFDVGRSRPLRIRADGQEARGGALGGALGLPADQTFALTARATGTAAGGRLDVRLSSGRRIPLDAHGSWTAAGGAVSGRAQLDASSLTRPYMRMFGSTALLAVAAERARGGRYGVALRLSAPNLAIAAQGPAELPDLRSTTGLHAAIVVADLSRVIGGPRLGAGRAQGLLSGDVSAWRFQGAAQVSDVRVDGYRLARVAGPVTVSGKGREITARISAAGAGGGGSGLLAGLMGGSPKASLEAARLPDGRVLIRQLTARGAGVQLDASGSRSLLGALQFKGRLQLTELGLARRGAAGALQAGWSASQARSDRPWLLSFDGRGAQFRSGLAELDRLLGPSPRLQGQAAWSGGAFAVSDLTLTGDKAKASAKGRFDPAGPLALETRWTAEGPFQAGPVQVSGKVSGSGAISGELTAPRADLVADLAAIDLPQLPLKAAHVHLTFLTGPTGLAGGIAVTGTSDYGPARASSAFRFVPGGVDLTGIDAEGAGVRAAGALSLRDDLPSTADLRIDAGPGVLLTQGRITGTVRIVDGAQPSGALELRATGAEIRGSGLILTSARLAGSGPLSHLPFDLSGDAVTAQGPISLSGSGVYAQTGQVRQASFTGEGRFGQITFRTLQPIELSLSGPDQTAHAQLQVGGGRFDLDLRQTASGATVQAALRGVDIKALDPDFEGRIDAEATLQGKGPRLAGKMTARLADARSLDAPSDVAVNAEVQGVLEDDVLQVQAQATGAKGLRSDVSLTLPVEASASPLHLAIVRNRPLHGRFTAAGEVQPLWNLVYGSERELAGQVRLDGQIDGTLNDPRLTGQAAVSGGRFRDFSSGLVLTDLSLNADLKGDTITLRDFSARDQKNGQVTGSGTTSLQRGGASTLTLQLKAFRVLDNDTAQASATGQMTVTRAGDGKVTIKGDLGIDRAEINAETKLRPSVVSIDVTEKNLPAATGQALAARPTPGRGPPIALDVSLRAPRHVFVRGRGVDAELSLDAHVGGVLAKPRLEGVARIVQGNYDFAGKRFEFDETGAIYLASEAERIRLDLAATWEAPSLTATIRIRGTAAKPEITLQSSPSLPQEEILAQVLFGASASQLSGAQTAQLASTVTSLATGGGFDVLGSLRQFAGLDRLAIGGDQVSGVTVAGGKYITNDVYLEVIGGGREGPTAEVDWRIRRGFSIVSQVGGQFGARLAVRWTHDLGRRRARAGGR